MSFCPGQGLTENKTISRASGPPEEGRPRRGLQPWARTREGSPGLHHLHQRARFWGADNILFLIRVLVKRFSRFYCLAFMPFLPLIKSLFFKVTKANQNVLPHSLWVLHSPFSLGRGEHPGSCCYKLPSLIQSVKDWVRQGMAPKGSIALSPQNSGI